MFTLEEIPATIVAVVRRKVPMADLQHFFGAAFGQVAGAVTPAGGQVVGPPFGWYHGMPADSVDVSVGFPVLGDVHTPDGGVHVVERPACRAVVGLHVGPYDSLPDTYAALHKWMAEQGLVPQPEMWEEYLSPPEGDPATWQTRIIQPVV